MSWETELSAGRGVIVDRSSPIPIYFQVATQLQKLIESDTIPVGTRFENEVDLAERLGVSRPTMRRAMQYLVERGMVVRKRGVGTQVVHPKVRRTIELSSLYDDLAKSGREPSTVVRSLTITPASLGIAAELGIAEGDDVCHIERVRCPVTVGWAEHDNDEFRRQSQAFAERLGAPTLVGNGFNHFDFLETMADARSPLGRAALNMLQ